MADLLSKAQWNELAELVENTTSLPPTAFRRDSVDGEWAGGLEPTPAVVYGAARGGWRALPPFRLRSTRLT